MQMSLAQKLQALPRKPGVYLFKDRRGEVLYVGKAKNLKNRIQSYFRGEQAHEPRIELMIQEIADLDYVIVSSETESLILENNFIKQYRPRYNVRLRDDKNYQFIKVDYETEIPQVFAVRRIIPLPQSLPPGEGNKKNISSPQSGGGKVGGRHFGPYTSSLSVKQTLKLLRRIFNLCGNKKMGKKACFYYHLNRCPGVCVGQISLEEYRKTFRQVEKFLGNRQSEVVANLKAEMKGAARKKQFEKAAKLRDHLWALKLIWEKQKVVFTHPASEDYLSLYQTNGTAIVNLFMVREGKLIRHEIFELVSPQGTKPNFILQSFVKQYYAEASDAPKIIVTPFALPELKSRVAKQGRRFQLLKLGLENAENYYQKNQASFEKTLAELRRVLDLPKIPARIEAYDISNIQGFLPVGSMVVFENGQPKKSDYRKFKINVKQTPDDFAMMREILRRRFRHSSTSPFPSPGLGRAAPSEVEGRERSKAWPLPDLIVIDGGRGQLNAALEVLKVKSLKLKVIGLAKKLEGIYLPEKKEPLRLPEDSPALHLLQRLRDEAHRFAIAFYRGRHRKEMTRTILSEIPGIGPVIRKKLLSKFGSVSGIRQASLEALAQIAGPEVAKRLKVNL